MIVTFTAQRPDDTALTVASLLARWGYLVLYIDWNPAESKDRQPSLLADPRDPLAAVVRTPLPDGGVLDAVAGIGFDRVDGAWAAAYSDDLGDLMEACAERWQAVYEIVVVRDAAVGHPSRGIPVAHLPDAVVVDRRGVGAAALASASDARHLLPYGRAELLLLPSHGPVEDVERWTLTWVHATVRPQWVAALAQNDVRVLAALLANRFAGTDLLVADLEGYVSAAEHRDGIPEAVRAVRPELSHPAPNTGLDQVPGDPFSVEPALQLRRPETPQAVEYRTRAVGMLPTEIDAGPDPAPTPTPAEGGTLLMGIAGGDVVKPVRVFISYAHESDEHVEQVRDLWIFLRAQRIDAKLDRAAAQRREDWVLWMADQVREADHVLVVASAAYRERAEGRSGPDVGRGVQYEARLIRDAFYANQQDLDRFVPVVLPGQSTAGVPDFLAPATTTVYTVDEFSVAGMEALLRFLLNQPEETEPPMGQAPVFGRRDHPLSLPAQQLAHEFALRPSVVGPLGVSSTFVGIDAGYENRWEAEKVALELHDTLLTTARTVVVHEVDSHYAMSFLLPVPPSDAVVNMLVGQGFGVAVRGASSGRLVGPETLRAGASTAAEAHQYRREGRALRFQGQRSLRGRHGVSDILAFTAIEAVLPRGTQTVDARDLTPFFRDGKLVLVID